MNAALGGLCEFVSGGTPSKNNPDYYAGHIPWITGADIVGPTVTSARSFITQAAVRESATNCVPGGAVLLVTRTSVGKVAVAERSLCFSQDITALIPDPRHLDTGYLVQFLRANQQHFERLSRGATIRGVPRSVVAELLIPLPSLVEQRRIAAILDQADALRTRRRAAIAQLDTLAQSIFVEMFGDPLANPRSFPVVRLGDLCESVIDCPHSTPIYAQGPTPYACIRSSDIQQGELILSGAERVEEEEYLKRVGRGKPQKGDVIYCREGARFGNAARLTTDDKVCLGQRMMLFRPATAKAVTEYIWAFLQTPAAYQQASNFAGGTASPHVNIREIVAFRVPQPPIALQTEFARRVQTIDRLRIVAWSSLANFNALFASLQQQAFSGRL